MEIYRDRFRSVSFEKNNKILYVEWFPESEHITDEEYLDASRKTPEFALQNKAIGILMNTLNFRFVVVPEIQKKLNEEVIPQYLKNGVKKFAMLIPQQLFSQISIEQAVDYSSNEVKQNVRYFDSEEKAEKWLTGVA